MSDVLWIFGLTAVICAAVTLGLLTGWALWGRRVKPPQVVDLTHWRRRMRIE